MKKLLLKLGKVLNSTEQKKVKGGFLTTPGGRCDAIEYEIPLGCPCYVIVPCGEGTCVGASGNTAGVCM